MERRLTKGGQTEDKKGVHNRKLKGREMKKKFRERDLEWSQSEREQRARLERRRWTSARLAGSGSRPD